MSEIEQLGAQVAALEEELARLKDLHAIEEVLARYSRALDWLDDAMLETVFYDDAEIDYGFFRGTGKDFKKSLMELEHGIGRRWHFTSQIQIDLDGDSADVESYNLSLALPEVQPTDGGEYSVFFGFYKDRLVKRGGKWGIIARKHIQVSGAPLAEVALEGDMGLLNQIGLTSPSHPDYRRLTSAEPLDNP
ncbi:MAG: hypothetical protein GWM88_00700 [Pseudomonadales bacterium]|nr:nuclear transport factor 2 family protein [Pseudomonadales bacterium]NIX06609.1 hypothetical protein [Pseudomonadales bacterium]